MNFKLNGGVLIIGSLYWQDYRDNIVDNIRKKWREENLEMKNAIDVSVPIRYGRFSGSKDKGNQTYTMVFDNTLHKNQIGFGKGVPFVNQPKSWNELKNEVIELSKAEGSGKKFLKGDTNWGVCCILFNPTIDKHLKEMILNEWLAELKTYETSYNLFKDDYSLFSTSNSGELMIEWPHEANDLDYLIATATRPKFDKDIIDISPKEVARYVQNRDYFINNLRHGIKTYQDEEIILNNIESIIHCIKFGIFPSYIKASQHLEVYKLIASNKSQLDVMGNKERQYLYYYLQQSAQRLMILETAKLYDGFFNKYETLSINFLFKKLENFEPHKNWSRLFEFNQSQLHKQLLDKTLLIKLESLNESNFLKEFKELKPELIDSLKPDLETIKTLRDKHVAHSEKVEFGTTMETSSIQSLIDYAHDIAQTFCIIYGTGGFSWSSQSDTAFFVQSLLDEDFG